MNTNKLDIEMPYADIYYFDRETPAVSFTLVVDRHTQIVKRSGFHNAFKGKPFHEVVAFCEQYGFNYEKI